MTERGEPGPPAPHDAAITQLLQRLPVPDHRPGFWDDLTDQIHRVNQIDRADRIDSVDRIDRELDPTGSEGGPVSALVARFLVAAVVLVVLGGVVLLGRGSGDRTQRVDSGPAATTGADRSPQPAVTDGLATTGTARAPDGIFAEATVWTGDEFATVPVADAHWTSPDGIDWKRRRGPGPAAAYSAECPSELTCEGSPDAPPVPFHFASPVSSVVARAGDVVLFQASSIYRVERPRFTSEGEQLPFPELHPALLDAAATGHPCFAQLARQEPAEVPGERTDGARLVSWSTGGLSDPIIRLTCTLGADTAGFELDLRDHLTDTELERVYSFASGELWVERAGSPPERVDDAPTSSYWLDGVVGGELVTTGSTVVSSGDRFWAVDEGTLVSSVDGSDWAAYDVATAGAAIAEVAASPGGHLALWLVEDRLVWDEQGQIIVSHDGGATWSRPVTSPRGSLAVGPAGAAAFLGWVDETETLAIVHGGRRSVVNLPDAFDQGYPVQVAVGTDRVLVWSDELMDVYRPDGTLLHRTTWSVGRDWSRYVGPGLAVAAAAAVAGVGLVLRGRRRAAGG